MLCPLPPAVPIPLPVQLQFNLSVKRISAVVTWNTQAKILFLMFLSWSCCDKHFRLNVPSHLKLNWTVSMTGSSDQGDNMQSVQTFYIFDGMHEVDVIYTVVCF